MPICVIYPREVDLLRVPAAILDSIESLHLPPIPQILLKFLRLADDDSTSISDLAEVVGQDPALSARLLTVANSPAVWRGVEAKSLTQCLVNLGTRLSRTLAACLVVQNFFSPTIGKCLYDFTGFWKHSLLLAEMSRAIAVEINCLDTDEAYLAGLLHDVGQLLLLSGVEKMYGPLLALSGDESDLRDMERENLDTDHAVIGAWLVDQWRLSSFMADAILFHHKPADEIVAADSLSQIVWSAHVLCGCQEPVESLDSTLMGELDIVNSILGVETPGLFALRDQCAGRVAQIVDALCVRDEGDGKPFPIPLVSSPDPVGKVADNSAPAGFRIEDAVRDMALMQSLQQDLLAIGSEEELLMEVRESARALFGVNHVAVLLVQSDSALLTGAPIGGQAPLLQRLQIPLAPPKSLAATVALGKHPVSTFEQNLPAPLSLADVQIARLLASEGVMYAPMRSPKQAIGVMVFGMNAGKYGRIRERLDWVASFGQLAAVSITTWREIREREQRLESAVSKRYELKARRAIHEAKNPLSIIKNYLNIVKKKLSDTNVAYELGILKEEIDRISAILRHMNSPAELLATQGSLDINSLIESMFALYGDSLFADRGIATEINLEPGLAAIDCDRDSAKQILINIWNNASDAMGAGDCFFVSTHANINQNGRRYLEIRLSDTGPGLPPDVMKNLFRPLEPGRRAGHSGLGLSIVAGLIDRLGGSITCQSSADRGTSFSILLPYSVRGVA